MSGPKKKILFITYFAANEPLLDSRTTPVLKEMSGEGIEYHLLTFEKRNLSFSIDRRSIENRFNKIGIKWHPLLYHKRPRVLSTIYDIFLGMSYAFLIAISERIDYIHAQTPVGGVIALPVAKVLGKKIIYDINGVLAEEYADIGIWKRGSLLFKIVRYFECLCMFSSDGVIPISRRLAERIIRSDYIPYKKREWKYQTIPSHVDIERFTPDIYKGDSVKERYGLREKFVLIYIGSVGTWYMLGEMLDFFKTLKKIVPSAVFLILSHSDNAIIQEKVFEKGIKAKDIIITHVLPEEVPLYLSASDAAICFIKPVFSKEICSPVKLGEYLAMGLPVIINGNIGDTEDLVRDNRLGTVINRFQEKEYEKAISELKVLIDTDKEMKQRCIDIAREHLSLEVSIENYKKLYKNVFGI